MNDIVAMADTFMQKDDAFLFHFDYIKWYEDYEQVGAITRFLNKLDNDEYHFCRIGEVSDDVEESGGFWDNPFDTGVIRKLNMNTAGATTVELAAFM